MNYLHTMVRVNDLDASSISRFLQCAGSGGIRRRVNEAGRFTLVFLAAPGDEAAQIELTHNWDQETSARRATSDTSPTRWTTFTRCANA